MIRFCTYSTPLGYLIVGHDQEAIVSLKISTSAGPQEASPVSDLAALQILEYLDGIRQTFDFPFRLSGTPFQLEVWNALLQIPYRQTRTYGQIAAAIGKPNAARAVGMACSKNPLWIVIPCHRVVGQQQRLTGYAGGLDMKQSLLELEQSNA